MFLRTLFEERTHPSKNTDWYRSLYGYEAPWTSSSGVTVTEDNAMELTAVWSAVTQLSAIIASLPLHLYKRLERGKEKAINHPLYHIMHLRPNPEQTSMIFREAQHGQLLVWGNSYAEKEMDNSGRLKALWPLLSRNMEIERIGGELIYKYYVTEENKVYYLRRDQVLHTVGFSSNGLMGINPVMKHREAIGLGKALNEYAGRFFSNGARPSAVLQHPMQLSQEAQERLRENWHKIYGGLDKSHRIAVLEEGMQLKEFGFSAAEAQSLESRRFTVSDIARIWNIPPHMLKDLDRATFSNIESQGEDFVRYCLGPWLVRIEQTYNTQLLSENEIKTHLFEHLVEGLLRGTTSERFSVYATGRQWGIYSINDCREKENLNPIEGGDIYMVPLNMIPADQVGKEPAFAPGGTPNVGTPQPEKLEKSGRSDDDDWEDVDDDFFFSDDGRAFYGHAGRPGKVGGSLPRGSRLMPVVGNMASCVGFRASRCFEDELEDRKNPRPTPCTDIVKREDGKYYLGGKEVSGEHIKRINKLAIPPAWTDVVVARDPNAAIQAIGKASNGKWQYRYSKKWTDASNIKKFHREKSFEKDIDRIRKGIERGIANGDTNAYLLRIMDKTAIRVGTNRDLKARKKAYGLTTLQHEHVKVSGSKISFDFIAKEGIRAKYEFTDKDCAKFISGRLSTTKKGQMLFPDTNANKFNEYLSKVAGGKKYTAKDFRTFHANVIAYREINKYSGIKFKTKKEKKAAIKDVTTKVSDFLRNTPNIAKNSYINPKVWDVIGGLK